MATLHFICGKAASGKTTLARELAARHAAVMFGEDEWLTLLDAEINSLADHVRHSKRLKAALAPLAVRLLQLGVPIVFDFAGNTPNDRAWVRSIFESANADHVLHYIVASDVSCKARLRLRNETKPEGLYFGFVSKAHPVVPGSPICGMGMPCGGRLRRAREGIEWLRAISVSTVPRGPKGRRTATGMPTSGSRHPKTGNPAPFQIWPATPIC